LGYLGHAGQLKGEDWVMIELSEEEFEVLVAEALDTLPPELARLMDNVVVFVEDQKPGQPRLLGLYEGVPLTSRGHYYSGHLPDRITIFRKPIQRRCRSSEEIVEQVRITVVHEIAHHFGIEEDRLHELGYG